MNQILEDVTDATLSMLVERWFAWRKDGGIPSRKAIEPLELGSALPFVWLCEKARDAECYRYRLVGEAVNTLYGKGLRGHLLKEVLPEPTAQLLRSRLDRCLAAGSLLHTIAPQTLHDRRHVLVQRLFLPFASESGCPDTILGCTKITGSMLGTDRQSARSHEASYSLDGKRLKVCSPALTMYSIEFEY
ncbi:PAS domain-containing protein [Nisaea acidiphila]|uniref:PAS domain-containing protein n=1 Tax=Nisaea acidiphila TaxID=1862145 RepID=A0A9J7AS67_9PROT|nr:PAS domain-containing protein [Nisaea acidiphila]UUX49172.1 PAS domain-containing protein [Nisaea acidiphila]